MIAKVDKNEIRKARHRRQGIKGTLERPRLCVYRSSCHIYAQVIDDAAGNTLASASTMEKDVKAAVKGKTKKEAARIVGAAAAKKAVAKGISAVIFDRGGYLYTGRVKELADGAREAGLKF